MMAGHGFDHFQRLRIFCVRKAFEQMGEALLIFH